MGEDSVMSVWTYPTFDNGDIPTSIAQGSEEPSLLCSDIVIDQVLTGVQFINCDHNCNICATSYDGDQIEIWKHNEHAEAVGKKEEAKS